MVRAARGEAPSVRVKREAPDRARVSFQNVNLFTRHGVPDSNGILKASGGEVFPVRAKRHVRDPLRLACQTEHFGMGEPLEVMPFPLAKGGRAVVEELLHPVWIAVTPL